MAVYGGLWLAQCVTFIMAVEHVGRTQCSLELFEVPVFVLVACLDLVMCADALSLAVKGHLRLLEQVRETDGNQGWPRSPPLPPRALREPALRCTSAHRAFERPPHAAHFCVVPAQLTYLKSVALAVSEGRPAASVAQGMGRAQNTGMGLRDSGTVLTFDYWKQALPFWSLPASFALSAVLHARAWLSQKGKDSRLSGIFHFLLPSCAMLWVMWKRR